MKRFFLRLGCDHAGRCRSRVDRDRETGRRATLTCHFLSLHPAALAVGSLAIGVIEFRRRARQVSAVGLAALRQARLTVAVGATVALAAITGAAEIEDGTASRTSTHSLADLDAWQGCRAFQKAGLDNGPHSWQA